MTATAKGLAQFHTAEEIREMWRQVLSAKLERSTINLHIHQLSSPDGRASTALTLATPAEQEQFMADCDAALAILANEVTRAPHHIDFSQRRIEV